MDYPYVTMINMNMY